MEKTTGVCAVLPNGSLDDCRANNFCHQIDIERVENQHHEREFGFLPSTSNSKDIAKRTAEKFREEIVQVEPNIYFFPSSTNTPIDDA